MPHSNVGRQTNNLFIELVECFTNDNNVINFGIFRQGLKTPNLILHLFEFRN